MATRRLHDIPIGPPRFAENREDPRGGEGPFVGLVSRKNVEQVTLNGLTWNGDHRGYVDTEPSTARYPGRDMRPQGNRANAGGRGGYNIINQPDLASKEGGGNRSGE